MNKLKVIIIDDLAQCIEVLERDLLQWPAIEVVAKATTAKEGKDLIVKHSPDILFLDINIPDMSGLELVDELASYMERTQMKVVFYSAFNEYIIDCLRKNAFDFLLKPYKQDELRIVVERLISSVSQRTGFNATILKGIFRENHVRMVQTVTGISFVKENEVVYFSYSKDQKCWEVCCVDGFVTRLKPRTVAEQIMAIHPNFVRINKYCIVNIDYLLSIENITFVCRLRAPYQNAQLVASRRCYAKLREMYDTL